MAMPKLRFPGFEDSWRKIQIKETVSTILDNRGKNPPYYVEQGIPVIDNYLIKNQRYLDVSQAKRFIDSNLVEKFIRKEIRENDLLITLVGNGIGSVTLAPTEYCVIIQNTLGYRFAETFHPVFMLYIFQHNHRNFKILNREMAQPNLKQSDVNDLIIALPTTKKEQVKIADFFTFLDRKIQLQQEKIDLLKEQKKGFMQKIFSQELRFKDADGQEFPECGNKPLGELGAFGVSYSYSRALEGEGFVQHVHYGDIHTKLPTICDKVQLPSITEQRDFEFVNEGDILFADASEDYNDLGKAILIKSLQSAKTVAGLHTHKFTPTELVYPLYLIYVTQTKEYREFIKKMGTGVSVLGISKTNLAKFDVLFPSLDEQKKIGDFLFSFEKKIHALNNQKDYLIQQKQAFMQQMFI